LNHLTVPIKRSDMFFLLHEIFSREAPAGQGYHVGLEIVKMDCISRPFHPAPFFGDYGKTGGEMDQGRRKADIFHP
jgi:hypothetical protein